MGYDDLDRLRGTRTLKTALAANSSLGQGIFVSYRKTRPEPDLAGA